MKKDKTNLNSLESLVLSWNIPNLVRFNKQPDGLSYRPDFICKNDVFINSDGLYWHSAQKKEIHYHMNMRKDFERQGMRIIQFREDEIRFKSEIVQSMIKNAIGMSNKMDARKCMVVSVSPQDCKKFFTTNHLMGNRSATGAFGLLYKNELVACLSYMQKGDAIEIVRFSCKMLCSVRGGFSRLLSQIDHWPTTRTIFSFCDLRYATGHSYLRNGFSLSHVSQGWSWTDGVHVFNRLVCRANMDARKLTEAEHANEMGFYKIYDAGQAKYIKHIDKLSKDC